MIMKSLQKKQGDMSQKAQVASALTRFFPGSVLKVSEGGGFPLLFVSACFYELTGFSPEEIRDQFGNLLLGLTHPGDVDALRQAFTQRPPERHFASHLFRLRHQRGHWLWTLCQFCRDGEDPAALLCLLVDITDFKQVQESLRSSVERHQTILDQSTDVLFEWDIVEDKISLSLNWVKRFGYFPDFLSVQDILESDQMIHPDDRSAFRSIAEQLQAGVHFVQADVRIQNVYGQMAWCRIRGTAQYGEDGRPVKAIGIILNIDEEREMFKQLREQAEHDALTGLYNKITTQSLIQEYLRGMGPKDIGALLLMDIDDFKQLNDTRGHLHGDSVLAQASKAMRKLIRNSDIVGRIGGDEFMVFIKNIPSEAFAIQKAEQLVGTLRQAPFAFTCSIGVAVVRSEQARFNDLYQAADKALYQAKKSGKGRVCLYRDGGPGGEAAGEAGGHSVLGAPIDSDQRAFGLFRQVLEGILEVLSEARTFSQVAEQILAYVGKRFDASRALVLEGALDGRSVRSAFDWYNGDCASQAPWLECLDACVLRECFGYVDADGCFYCDDPQAAPPQLQAYMKRNAIRSAHICSVRKHGEPGSLVCFEQREGRRVWVQEDLDALVVSSKVLGRLVLKVREQARQEGEVQRMRTLLDNQPGWVYVVDPTDHRLLYSNQTLGKIIPELRVGMRCHEALSHRATPCEQCPMAMALRGQRGEAELWDTPIGQWSAMHAVPISWKKKDAFLLTGYDIRRYKQGTSIVESISKEA